MLSHRIHAKSNTIGWHSHASPIFNMIAFGKIKIFVVEPPRGVDMHSSHSVFVVSFTIYKVRHNGHSVSPRGVVYISSHDAVAVSKSVWMGFGFGIQHDSGTFASGSTQYHHPCSKLVFFHVHLADIGDSGGFSLIIRGDFPDHGMCDKIDFPLFHGGFHQAGSRRKVCVYLTGPVTLITEKAHPPFVINWPCQDGNPRRNHRNIGFLCTFLHEKFMQTRFWRRKKMTIRFIIHTFFTAKNSYQLVYLVIIWFKIIIADGPVVAHSIYTLSF